MQKKIFIILIVLFLDLSSGATDYYMDTGASGANDGSSPTDAWETWAKADTDLDALGDDGAGDTLIVYNGSYGDLTGGVLVKERTDWLTIQAATGEEPDINSISLTGSSPETDMYLKFVGMDIDDCVFARYVNQLWFEDCEISAEPVNVSGFYEPYWAFNDDRCIWVRDGSHITVKNCDITGGFKGIQITYPMSNVTIEGCTLHNLAADGFSFGACDDLIISDNLIYDIDCRRTSIGIIGTQSGVWTADEVLIQDVSGAEGIYDFNTPDRIYAFVTTEQEWAGINTIRDGYDEEGDNGTITGQSSGETLSSVGDINPAHTDGMEVVNYESNHNAVNVTISRNIVLREIAQTWAQNDQGGKLQAFPTSSWTNFVVVNNVFRSRSVALYLVGVNGIVFNNNTLIDGNLRIDLLASQARDIQIDEFYNNIIETLQLDTDDYGKTIQIVLHGNNIFGNDPDGDGGPAYPFAVNGTELVSEDLTTGYFTNYTGNIFTIADGSTAIDFGNATYAPTLDLLSRTRSGSPEAGAYEYIQYLIAKLIKTLLLLRKF